MVQSPCLINNHSVSPLISHDVAPLLGTSSSHQEASDVLGEGEIQAPMTPVGDTERDSESAEVDREEDAPAAGEGAGEEEEDERKPKIGKRPLSPTKTEIEEHYPLHLKYRSWCLHCRAGKMRLNPHV